MPKIFRPAEQERLEQIVYERKSRKAYKTRKLKEIDVYSKIKDLDGLTKGQRAFVREYVRDWNGTQAAIRAGYSEMTAHTQAWNLLKHPKVIQAINAYEKDLGTRFMVTKERVLKEMGLLAFSDLQDYVTEDGFLKVKNLKDLPPQVTRAIKKVKFERVVRTRPGSPVEISNERCEFELYDKKGALEKMGQELGMFVDRKELSGPGGVPLVPSNTTVVFDFGEETKEPGE